VHAWQVLHENAVEGRFEAFHSAALTPLIARELLSAEAGVGKSRLLAAFQEKLQGEPHTRLRYFCSPHHKDSALHPIISQLERAAGFDREDTPEVKLGKLEALLQAVSTGPYDVMLLAELLSLPTERYPPVTLSPQLKKQRTLEALLRQLQGLSKRTPVLMAFEDAHWIDPTTLELLHLTVEHVQTLPMLILLTCRPEFQAPWGGQPHVRNLVLGRLNRRDSAALVVSVGGEAGLAADIVEEIVERTDGVPLFVEELTKAVLETSAAGGDARGTLSRVSPRAGGVPETLQASLMSRLDLLGPEAKEIAQVGAAIGGKFSCELLGAVARKNADELQRALGRMTDAGLVFGHGAPPGAVYTFKHALVQDTAYATLLRGRRRELHARIALALEQRFPEIGEAQPELLARHLAEGGAVARAVDFWHKAARVALTRSAVPEAVAQLKKALAALEELPEGLERQGHELDLQMTLGGALIAAKGYAAPETGAAFARARELCEWVGDAATAFRVLYGEWAYLMVKGEVPAGYEVTQEFLRLAERKGSSDVLVIGHRAVGANALVLGRLDVAETHLQRALALYDPAEHRSLHRLYAFDPGPIILAWLVLLDFLLGRVECALLRSNEAVATARDAAHPATRAYALNHAVQLRQLIRDRPAVDNLSSAQLVLTDEHGFPFWGATARMQRGWLAALERPPAGAIAIRDGLEAYRVTGSEHMVPYYGSARRCPCGLRAGRCSSDAGRGSAGSGGTQRRALV
jgi:predicted ATPase